MSNETQNSVPKYLSTPERIASELDSIRDRLMTRGIVSGERLYGCDEWSEPVVRLQKVIEALQAQAHDGEAVYQVQDSETFEWFGVPKAQYEHVPDNKRRILFTAPPRVVDEAMVLRAARVLSDRAAGECNVDREDQWEAYFEEYMQDAQAALKAALEQK